MGKEMATLLALWYAEEAFFGTERTQESLDPSPSMLPPTAPSHRPHHSQSGKRVLTSPPAWDSGSPNFLSQCRPPFDSLRIPSGFRQFVHIFLGFRNNFSPSSGQHPLAMISAIRNLHQTTSRRGMVHTARDRTKFVISFFFLFLRLTQCSTLLRSPLHPSMPSDAYPDVLMREE